MSHEQDETALRALADALADAGRIHRSAAGTAGDPGLTRIMNDRADRLEALASKVSTGIKGKPGSMLQFLDRLKLGIDQWFGDDDDAAVVASREAKDRLRILIDDYAEDSEIDPDVRAAFLDIRDRIGTGAPAPTDTGLTSLPN
ncbi:ferritin family protein [Sphingomonas baiyangensis]|uniref:DUF2383 domain-containing protein n=1 Tax=Sphingomonas baiyangensis TaxID=2572576 RepID=A0A4U1L4S3_9SPHN|nr:hypothetical protein [Sphingomonas baiyangensis]TKD51534.1 hypothetical protein FBR43_12795 [Sphingomonas baiyangensis]